MEREQLERKARELRKKIMEVCYKTRSGHPSSALSCVEILTALYYGGFLGVDKYNYKDDNRNRFHMSKGHGCVLQYVILADLGILDQEHLWQFCRPGALLGAHPNPLAVPGIESVSGSLGHGLAYAMGVALGAKYRERDFQVYTVLGDGECQEGSIWESALCAGNHHLDNLTVIIDNNGMQASDYTVNVSDLSPLREKWDSFKFQAYEVAGHDIDQIIHALQAPFDGKPKAIIANTRKGKGVSLIENQKYWHGRKPNDAEWEQIRVEMNI